MAIGGRDTIGAYSVKSEWVTRLSKRSSSVLVVDYQTAGIVCGALLVFNRNAHGAITMTVTQREILLFVKCMVAQLTDWLTRSQSAEWELNGFCLVGGNKRNNGDSSGLTFGIYFANRYIDQLLCDELVGNNVDWDSIEVVAGGRIWGVCSMIHKKN